MAYQSLGLGSSANDGTGDDLRTGGDKINDNFVELYTKLGTGSALTTGLSATASVVTLTSPEISGSIIFEGSTADAYETTLSVTDPTADRTITLPNSTGTVSLLTATETLTNKTLTAPKIADAGFIADANGNEQVIFQTTASAVNEIEITNAATGGAASAGTSTAPIIGASGETNVDLALLPKGTGHVAIRSTTGTNNQGAIRLNCENNTHGQTLMGQPHSAGDSGFFQLPLDGGSARATPNVLLSGAKTVGAVQTITSSGAVSLNTLVTVLNSSSGVQALTLAAGVAGQVKIISMVTAGNASTMTVSNGNLAGMSTSIVWDAIGEGVTLLYNGAKWVVVGQFGVTIS